MKEITVIEPAFFSDFKCIGNACRDHCCKGWEIQLDKSTVNRYLKSGQIEIRNIAEKNIIKLKKNHDNWGKIKLSENGTCAFMDDDRLCKVHKSLGENALSPTCATYPRVKKHFKNEIRQNLTLSCPEATRKLLTDRSAMLFNERRALITHASPYADISQESKLINLMCVNIINVSGSYLEEGFYGIALLFLYFDKVKEQGDKYEKLENKYFSIIDSLQNGKISSDLSEIKPDLQLQWALLLRLQVCLSGKSAVRGGLTLQHYVNKLLFIQSEGLENDDVNSSMNKINVAWHEKITPWLRENPHLLNNYIQYRLYSDVFPSGTHENLSKLYFLVSEWFLIKSILSACVELTGTINEDDVINVIYSYHAVTKHDPNSEKAFLYEIEKTKVNDDLSLIYLLK